MVINGKNIKLVRERENKTQQEFADKMGISRELENKIEKGKIKISPKIILWFREFYPNDFEETTGYKSKLIESKTGEKDHSYKSGVPIFEVHLSSSLITMLKDNTAPEPAFYMKGNQFGDCTLGALAKGDYAMTMIRSGDFLLCREVEDYQFIDYSCIYFVAGKNGLELCRYIHPHPTDNKILLLKSDLPDVPSSPLPKQFIAHLFKIRGIIRSF